MKKPMVLFFVLVVILAATQAPAQEAVLTPPDGVPRIPLALAANAGRYAAYRSASLSDWHP